MGFFFAVTSSAHYVGHPCPTTDQTYQEISSNQNTGKVVCVCVKDIKKIFFLELLFIVELQNKHYVDHLCPATDHPYQDVSNQIKGNIICEYVQNKLFIVCDIKYATVQISPW